jgi:protein-disulfide isomerase
VPASPTVAPSTDDEAPPERSRRLLIVLGALGGVSAVIAALVIVSSGGSDRPAEAPVAQVRTSGQALLLGKTGAPTKIVVYDDFGGRESREFEIASRDFLDVEAAQGKVLVEYRPVDLGDGYSTQALRAWSAVVQHGTARQAKAYRDLLFDQQPDPGTHSAATQFEAWSVDAGVKEGVVSDGLTSPDSAFVDSATKQARAARVKVAPTVLVDGHPVGSGDGIELADRLQREILGNPAAS